MGMSYSLFPKRNHEGHGLCSVITPTCICILAACDILRLVVRLYHPQGHDERGGDGLGTARDIAGAGYLNARQPIPLVFAFRSFHSHPTLFGRLWAQKAGA